MKINKWILLATTILCCELIFSQTQSDAERLANLDYMKRAEEVNCEQATGTSVEQKICLNLEFQKADSLLNKRYMTLCFLCQTLLNEHYCLHVIHADAIKAYAGTSGSNGMGK